MKPRIVKVDDTWSPIRGVVISRETGLPFTGLEGLSATFRLYDVDQVTKLLDDVPATVLLSEGTLVEVRFVFSSLDWLAIKTAKFGKRLAVGGYTAEWKLTTVDGGVWFVPRSDSMDRIRITLQAT
jgi:hypothetical protein